MIEMLDGFPETVLAFSAKGRVTRRDYDEVLVPVIEAALRRYDKLRLYYELGPDMTGFDAGAMWEDFKIGMGHWSRWGRVAVVTDIDWMRHAVSAFRFIMPEQVRVFASAQAAEAREWIVG
ncbi:MAG TPA: STAS/SEC14 domain-containing protein [Stellaceae bacterium]|nr:STAS/SEC14 domain-containing protein [Stellaceae bacterium]